MLGRIGCKDIGSFQHSRMYPDAVDPGENRSRILLFWLRLLPVGASLQQIPGAWPISARLKEKDTNMIGPARITALAVTLAGMVLSMSGCHQLQARDQLNKGVDAYKSAHYEEAIDHFQRATELDPNLPMAKTYLATALAQDVVPGLATPDNLKYANQAIDLFKQVLEKDPSDVNSMKQIAGIYYSIASHSNPTEWLSSLESAKEWQKKVLAVDPNDPEAAYTIGVIDWNEAHETLLETLQSAGLNDDGAGNLKAPKKLMDQIKDKTSPLVDEGLKYLNQAVSDRANYDEAMAYLNLIYRSKANVDFGEVAAVKADLAQAEKWRTQAMGTRKANEEKKANPQGITMGSGNGE
jgi:tetratricopeptide (TPR) repeat protein